MSFLSVRLASLAFGSIALVGTGFVLVPLTAQMPAPPPLVRSVELPEPDLPPPLELSELQLPQAAVPVEAEPETGETYELTLDLARGDSVELMLADIHVAEGERKRADQA